MEPHIELHIEELILHGFSGYNAYQIREAIEREIARLLQEEGLPSGFSIDTYIGRMNVGPFHLQPNAEPETVGNNIANSLFKEFAK